MTDSQQLAEEYADRMVESLSEAWEAVDAGTDVEGRDPLEALEDMVLEVVHRAGAPFAVVLTVGGPHAEVVAHLDDTGSVAGQARVEVTWGTGSARRYDKSVTRTAEHFAGFYQG